MSVQHGQQRYFLAVPNQLLRDFISDDRVYAQAAKIIGSLGLHFTHHPDQQRGDVFKPVRNRQPVAIGEGKSSPRNG